ncbi:uncharacterized protein LOC134834985 [Culicoides brevitarsis]|uniref:uncharacterized protein LOC134834985 n=1 Tax=Culicoides brevitarsis TaxID=469753 RepID=UPI00307BE86A
MSASENPNHVQVSDLSNTGNSSLTIMDLKDDCLLEIFENLNLWQLLNIRQLCQRFSDLTDRFRYKYATFTAKIRNDDKFISIIKYVGPCLKDVHLYKFDNGDVLEAMLKFCPNLENLTLYDVHLFTRDKIMKLKSVVRNLKHLCLWNCKFNDDLGECFKGASSLESLNVRSNHVRITKKFFRNISSLKRLSIRSCVYYSQFAQVLINNPMLEVFHTEIIYDGILNDLVRHAPGVKELELTFFSRGPCPSISCLSDLPNLKSLAIHGYRGQEVNLLLDNLSTKNIIEELTLGYDCQPNMEAIIKLTNLKKLKLYGDELKDVVRLPDLQKEKELLNLINSLKKLKKINLRRTNVTFEFVKNLIKMLKQQAESRSKLEVKVSFVFFEDCLPEYEASVFMKDCEDKLKMLLAENKQVLEFRYYECR